MANQEKTRQYKNNSRSTKKTNIPHWNNILNFGAKCHAILAKPNGVLPFANAIMSFQFFL
jgi:hypothetical protein